ncbi:MAG: hypothetical protein K8G79_02095 [bacterium]|uniref:Transposase DDE domain-containing protein n=1 Tax=Candidatus Methylomirabilis tolerans TaxID=3123416 RepID=A0AAJ1AFZ6_9BACT|nr:hypothetical protein [Candidatus Methylomirabilis sp.]
MWAQYVQLTEAEAALRALKSELVIQPIWHQKASRMHAHNILVASLCYALWVTLKYSLKRAGLRFPPQAALSCLRLRGIKSGDILLDTTDGRTLRRVSRPDVRQQMLLDQLRLSLPERLGRDTECSGDSMIVSQANQGVAVLL